MSINTLKEIFNEDVTLEDRQECFRLLVTAKIYKIMIREKISKSQLAELMETSKSAITRLLSGDRNFTINKLYELYYHLGAEPDIIEKLDNEDPEWTLDNFFNVKPVYHKDDKDNKNYVTNIEFGSTFKGEIYGYPEKEAQLAY